MQVRSQGLNQIESLGGIMKRIFLLLVFICAPALAFGQQRWVQIEAQPSLLEAEAHARDHARSLSDVQAFSIGSGWYAIALGPYPEKLAQETLDLLLAAAAIPSDSFLSSGTNYRQKIWPAGADNDVTILPSVDPVPENVPTQTDEPVEVIETSPEPSTAMVDDETPNQARESEAALSQAQKEQLQVMLKWAGFYNSTIDGAFGPGTRSSMAAWQTANNFDATGILTTFQRQTLIGQYNAIFDGLGIEKTVNLTAGIAMDLPLGKVAFSNNAAPLVHYTSPTGGIEHVFMISQAGDQDDLAALFEVLQTLTIIPRDAKATLSNDSFEISGTSTNSQTFVSARLSDGAIKGYGIVWPNGNRELVSRLIARINASFEPRTGAMTAADSQNVSDGLDLVYGLELRRPLMVRSGVYIGQNGTLITAAESLDLCTSFVIEGEIEAKLVEPNLNGIAILQPLASMAPPATAFLAFPPNGTGQDVYLTSYPYGGRLNAPTVTKGSVEDLRGLDNDPAKMRLEMPANSNDIGGGVYDQFGGLVGILVSPNASGRILPSETQVAINLPRLIEQGTDIGMRVASTTDTDLREEALVSALSGPTALIECWEN